MQKYYKLSIAALFIIFFAAFLFLFSHKSALAPEKSSNYETREIKISGTKINVEIADTLKKQEKGLSGRQSLGENQGMLFIFPEFGYYNFWMKDMNFSLDFIWISGTEIVEITRNIKPEDYEPASTRQSSLGGPPKSLASKNKIDKVLEINAGVAEKLGIKEGDKIKF